MPDHATPKEDSGTLRDGYDRQIDYLRVSVTSRCNLNCVYCSPGKKGKRAACEHVLEADEIERVVRLLARRGLRKVRITGGEPLLRRDLCDIVRRLSGTGIKDLSLTTNGTLLAEMAQSLKEAGLRRVNISLDTLNPERYRGITRGGDIRRVWNAIEAAEAAGLRPVKINVVLASGLNDDEIVDFGRLTLDRDFHVRFIELMPAEGAEVRAEDAHIEGRRVLERLRQLGRLQKLPFRGGGPSRNWKIEGARGVIGIISPYSGHFCKSCNRLRLSADGRIRPCLFSEKTVDLATALRSGATDEELEKLLLWAVSIKPRGNELGRSKGRCEIPSMARIGG